jgi:hypothetical protein
MTDILTKTHRADAWAWTPPLPLQGIPVLVWPPRPGAALRWFASVSCVRVRTGSVWFALTFVVIVYCLSLHFDAVID